MPRPVCSACRLLSSLFALPALLLSLAVAADDGEAAWDAGVAAFGEGAYREAVVEFLRARAGGFDTPALDYNLGVSHFRLGELDAARGSFARATRDPELAALSHYNLGLIAVRLGDEDEAREWLRLARDGAGNDRLRALALEMLARLDDGGIPSRSAPGTWNALLNGGVGYDSNVLLVSDDTLIDSSDRDDFFLDLLGHAWREWSDAGSWQPAIDASLWLLRHRQLDEYDVTMLRAGGSVTRPRAGWRPGAELHGAITLLDDRSFTREILFGLRADRRLDDSRLRLHYELARIDAIGSAYRYLDGWRQRIDARLARTAGPVRIQLRGQAEINRRADLGDPLFTSFSPLRGLLEFGAEIPLRDDLTLRGELQYLHSRYRDPNLLPGDITRTRVDRRAGALVRVTRGLGDFGELSLEYRHVNNESTITAYDYDRHRYLLGWLMTF